MDNNVVLDSLIANEFAFEIDGEVMTGVFRVSGLVSFASDEDGNRIKPPFEVSKMVQRDADNAFNQWIIATQAERDSTARAHRSIAVVAIDDGVETRRWTIKNAWIRSIRYSDFDSGSFEMVAETFVICYDDIEEQFSASE